MIDTYERYAVAWIPASGSALAKFGAAWTGWCAEAGEFRQRLSRAGLPMRPDDVTGALGRVGLHAQIRAPFRLRPGRSHWLFERELSAITECLEAFTTPRLAVAVSNGRVSLVPTTESHALDRFMWQMNHRVEPFDAGPGCGEPIGLSRTREALLGAVGARRARPPMSRPRRFEIALTRRLAPEEAEAMATPLARLLEPVLAEPVRIDNFALIGDPGDFRQMRVIDRFRLAHDDGAHRSVGMPCFGPALFTSLGSRAESSEFA